MSLKKPIHITPLIEDCLAGKQQAQFTLYQQYNKAMYNTALRIVKDEALAEDVMQESFLSAFQKMDHFSGLVTFGAWLKKIVVNNAIAAYRKQKKEPSGRTEELLYHSPYVVPEEDKENEEHTNKKKAALVVQTIQQLKESYSISLSLHLLEGYTHEEVAEILSISSANCRTTFFRAKEQLRKKLEVHPIWKRL